MQGNPWNSLQEPGGRRGAAIWQLDDSVYLLGGYGVSHTGALGDLSDLWKYQGSQWTYMGGTNGVSSLPNVNEPSALQWPSARRQACTWEDKQGILFLFGGFGVSASGAKGDLADMWMYRKALSRWEPMALSVGPSARSDASCWSHGDSFYLFGGFGSDGFYNDMWMFNTLTLRWTRIGGQEGPNQPGVTQSIPSNRYGAASFVKKDGAHILGGYSSAFLPTAGYMNDHWVFNMTTKAFVRLGDSSEVGPNWASGCRPGGAVQHSLWSSNSDSSDAFWTFGGYGVAQYRANEAPETMIGYLNQLYYNSGSDTCSLVQLTQLSQSSVDPTTSAVDGTEAGSSTVTIAVAVVVVILVICGGLAVFLGYKYRARKLASAQREKERQQQCPGSPMSPGSPTALNPNAVEMRELRAASDLDASPKETRSSAARMLDFNE